MKARTSQRPHLCLRATLLALALLATPAVAPAQSRPTGDSPAHDGRTDRGLDGGFDLGWLGLFGLLGLLGLRRRRDPFPSVTSDLVTPVGKP